MAYNNFTNSEMCDMVLIYGECGRRLRKAARRYARRYPERQQPNFKFFARLESRLRENGQFRRAKPAGTYLFIRFSSNTILNIFFYHYFRTSYRASTTHKYRADRRDGDE